MIPALRFVHGASCSERSWKFSIYCQNIIDVDRFIWITSISSFKNRCWVHDPGDHNEEEFREASVVEKISSHCEGTLLIPAAGKKWNKRKCPRQLYSKQGFHCLPVFAWLLIATGIWYGRPQWRSSRLRFFVGSSQVLKEVHGFIRGWWLWNWFDLLSCLARLSLRIIWSAILSSRCSFPLRAWTKPPCCWPVEHVKNTKMLSPLPALLLMNRLQQQMRGHQNAVKTSGMRTQAAWAVACCRPAPTPHGTALDQKTSPQSKAKRNANTTQRFTLIRFW